MTFPILNTIFLLPFLSSLWIVLAKPRQKVLNGIALAGSFIVLVLSLAIFLKFDPTSPAFQLIETFHGNAFFAVDGINILFLPLTALLIFLGILYESGMSRFDSSRNYFVYLLILEGSLMGSFLTSHLLWFVVFYLIEIIPGYVLISRYGKNEKRNPVARKYLYSMMFSTLLVLAGFTVMAYARWKTAGNWSWWISDFDQTQLPLFAQKIGFIFLFVAFAIKIPVFPFHFWLPQVLNQGPLIGIGVFLLGVKLGAYGMIRFLLPHFPSAIAEWDWIILAISSVGMIYASFISYVQTNIRGLISYASIAHMGIIIAGVFMMNFYGMEGAFLQVLSSGIGIAGLCFLAGFIQDRFPDIEHFKGGMLGERFPQMPFVFLVVALSIVGMPGTSGFNSEHLIMLGALQRHWLLAVVAGASTLFAASYFIRYYQQAFCDADEKLQHGYSPVTRKLDFREWTIVVIICAVIFGTGLLSSPFLRIIEPSIKHLLQKHKTSSGETHDSH